MTDLPFRKGVGIIILNRHNKIFVGKRRDYPTNKWQMPQGGIDEGENEDDALIRELHEETGIQKDFEICKKLDKQYSYLLPKELLGKIWGGKYKGQIQTWFILRYSGNDNQINLNLKNGEFVEWKWVEVEELVKTIVDFKKDLYAQLSKEIFQFIN